MDQLDQRQHGLAEQPPPRQGSSMMERLWKSHPWQSDAADTKTEGKSAAPPVVSPRNSRRPWSAPWRKDAVGEDAGADDADQDISDEISLGGVSLGSVQEDDNMLRSPEKVVPVLPVLEELAASKMAEPPALPRAASPPLPAAAAPVSPETTPKKKATTGRPPSPEVQLDPNDENAELLAIDFDRDAEALKEAIGEDVLAMWQAQGLYQDMPEIRDEILKGVVNTKFEELRQEQQQLIEKRKADGLFLSPSKEPMAVISEEEEEEYESSDEEATAGAAKPVPPPPFSLEEHKKLSPQEQARNLHSELVMRLKELDTDDHVCVEANGRLGQLTERETAVAIRDHHAFNKFKLHEAVEKRVSKIFTGDHHVVKSFDDESKDEDDDDDDLGGRRASLHELPSHKPEVNKLDLRERLSTSFSAFEALMESKHKKQLEFEEETIIEEVVEESDEVVEEVEEVVTEDDEASFMEYTIRDETIVVDVDELFDKKRKEKETKDLQEKSPKASKALPRILRNMRKPLARMDSAQSSYVEMTVNDETVPDVEEEKAEATGLRESMITIPGERKGMEKQESLGTINGTFPTITMTELDDDELTQITFDHTINDANSTTQDHNHAAAYFNRSVANGKGPSTSKTASPPRGKYASGQDSEHSGTRETVPMDESSYSHHQGSVDGSHSRDSGAALSKSVSKILRVEIWSPKVKVVQAAMEKLAKAASQGYNHRANIARLGGAIAIVQAMRVHTVHLEIQRSACAALAELSLDAESQVALSEVGGVAAVSTAMEAHPGDLLVQQAACRALANITIPRESVAVGMSDSEDDEDSSSSGGGGVVKALVTAMNTHSCDSEVQAKAFGALANLCLDNSSRLQELSESGGLTAMTLALQKPWTNKMDQHEAISTLSILLRSLAELSSNTCGC